MHALSLSGLSHTLSLSGPSLPTAPPPPLCAGPAPPRPAAAALPRSRLAGAAPPRCRPCASARPRPTAAAWRAAPSTCRSRPCSRSRASRRRCWSPREEVPRRPSLLESRPPPSPTPDIRRHPQPLLPRHPARRSSAARPKLSYCRATARGLSPHCFLN